MGVFRRNRDWFIDYRLLNGRRKREKIGPSKKLAESVLAKRRVQVAEGKFLDKKDKEKIKFADFSKAFLEIYSKPNKKSWKSDYYNLIKLKSFFGNKYLYQIKVKDIEEYKSKRREEVSSATVNRELACVKTLFRKAVEWEKIDVNPAKSGRFFREDNKRIRYLEKEEIKRLVECCGPKLKPIVILALNTGMRRGEILNLKWHDIDFRRDIIYLLDTKNKEKREIYMTPLVRRTLRKINKHPDTQYVFHHEDGSQIRDIRKPFFTALQKASIINFRFHDLRHTFGSHLVMTGVDLKTVQELMGHKDIRMTLRYAHLSHDHKRHALGVFSDRMDTFWTPKEKSEESPEVTILQPFENQEVS